MEIEVPAEAFDTKKWVCKVRSNHNVATFIKEFVLELPEPADVVIRRLLERGIAAGFPLLRYYPDMARSLLVAVTEKRTREEMSFFLHALEMSL